MRLFYFRKMKMIKFPLRGSWGLEGIMRDSAQSLSCCLIPRKPWVNPYKLKIKQVWCVTLHVQQLLGVRCKWFIECFISIWLSIY